MTLSELRTKLLDLYGNTLTTETNFLTEVINTAYRKICALSDWWWLDGSTVLTIDTIVTEATSLSLTNGNTAIDVGAAVSTAYIGGFLATGEYTYNITAVSASTITVGAAFLDDTSTSQDVSFWNDIKDLPEDFGEAVQVMLMNDPNHKPLSEVYLSEIEVYGPDTSDIASEWPCSYAVFTDVDSTAGTALQVMKMKIYPPPEDEVLLRVRYRKVPTDLTNDGDIPLIPLKHHQTLLDVAKVELLKNVFEYKDIIGIFEAEANKGIARMIADSGKAKVDARFDRVGSVSDRHPLPFKTINTSVTSV